MANRETGVMNSQLAALSKEGCTAWRNNTGTGWVGTGKPFRVSKPTKITMMPGDVLLRGPVRPLHAGLCKGSSDIIGAKPLIIQPHHVGRRIAVFTAIETKAGTKPSDEQRNFLNHIQAIGGLAGVAKTDDEARAILRGFDSLAG